MTTPIRISTPLDTIKESPELATFRPVYTCQRCAQLSVRKLVDYLEDNKLWKLCPTCILKEFQSRQVKKINNPFRNDYSEMIKPSEK